MNAPLAALPPGPRTTATNEMPRKEVEESRAPNRPEFGSLLAALAAPEVPPRVPAPAGPPERPTAPADPTPAARPRTSSPGADRRTRGRRPGEAEADTAAAAGAVWAWNSTALPTSDPVSTPSAPVDALPGSGPSPDAASPTDPMPAGKGAHVPQAEASTQDPAAPAAPAFPATDPVDGQPDLAMGQPGVSDPKVTSSPDRLLESMDDAVERVADKADVNSKPRWIQAARTPMPDPDTAGTGSADREMPMKATLETTKSSGSAGQELPAGLVSFREGSESAWKRDEARMPARTEVHVSPQPSLTDRMATPVIEERAAASATPATAAAWAPLAEQIDGAVVRFQQRGREDFEVAIRPDADTEIRLQVTLRDGSPEVRAEWVRGDATASGPRWQELHDRLAAQGFRLVAGTDSFGSSAGFDSRRESGSRRGAEFEDVPGIVAERESAPRTPRKNRARSLFGWESWA